MAKKCNYTAGDVLSISVEPSLYVLAEVLPNHLIRFFNSKSVDGNWQYVDLAEHEALFTRFVSTKALSSIADRKLTTDQFVPSATPSAVRMLDANIRPGTPLSFTVDLVELGDDYEPLNARIIRSNLDAVRDKETIYDHELTGMVGDSAKLVARLKRYFESGINWDDQKSIVFPGMSLPPARKE